MPSRQDELGPTGGRNYRFRQHEMAETAETKVLNDVLSCVSVVCVANNTRTSSKKGNESAEIQRWFLQSIKGLGLVAGGSLSLRKSPCIRQNCPACAAGEGHRSYVLYGRRAGKRYSAYVPAALVPEIRTALKNGDRLRDLITEAGIRYLQAVKDEHAARKGRGDDDA